MWLKLRVKKEHGFKSGARDLALRVKETGQFRSKCLINSAGRFESLMGLVLKQVEFEMCYEIIMGTSKHVTSANYFPTIIILGKVRWIRVTHCDRCQLLCDLRRDF